MLYALTFRVFLLTVATSVMIMALDAFKKNMARADVHPRRGGRRRVQLQLVLRRSAYAPASRSAISAERGAESAGQGEGRTP